MLGHGSCFLSSLLSSLPTKKKTKILISDRRQEDLTTRAENSICCSIAKGESCPSKNITNTHKADGTKTFLFVSF